MPIIIPNGYAQFTLEWGGVALPEGAATVFGTEVEPGDTPTALAEGVSALVETTLLTVMSTEVTLVSVVCKKGPTDTGPFARVAAGVAGDQAGDPVSPAVSVLVSKQTASGGRKNRGRMYLPGLREANVSSGGVISSTNRTAWQAAVDDFFDGLGLGLIPMVILHTSNVAPTPVTALSVQSVVATQRLRQRR